jgi:hypothetical protein
MPVLEALRLFSEKYAETFNRHSFSEISSDIFVFILFSFSLRNSGNFQFSAVEGWDKEISRSLIDV